MNLRGLRLFRQIVLTGSLGEAARRLNLSSSAASRMLSQLEHDCGLTLFSRSRRSLNLSEDGVLFYRQISNTLIGIDEIPTVASDIRNRDEAWLSVVTAAPLANGLVVPAIARMHAAGTAFQCTVNVETRFDIESKVAARAYNLGVISLPLENEIIDLDIMPFLRTRLCVLLPKGHPLELHDTIDPESLAGQQFATLAKGQLWRRRLDALMGEAGQSIRTPFETGSTLVTVEMVRSGLGITLIDPVCGPTMPCRDLAMRPVTGNHWNTYASLRPKGSSVPMSEAFLDAMCAHVETMRGRDAATADLMELI